MIGETISHYRIMAKIGAGGMGEVYSAHDPRLDRQVAIKVLPSAALDDSTRLARFEREARSTGALNHPNIVAIYDVGQHEGMPFIVTELLEGSTLRHRLREGDVTVRRAVEYGIQIAEGLAAAHSKGIIHRDLKPENVFVTRDGHIKILDFGLAKLHQPAPGRGASEQQTQTVETEAGAIVGTLGYMSPEQLHGKPADHRSDVFAFGALMYEMLAGRRAFSGDSKANVVAAILRDDPVPFAQFSRPVPAQLEQLIWRCLDKRPEGRFDSVHDLALALQAIQDSSDWTTATLRLPTAKTWRRARFIGGSALGIVVAALAIWGVIGDRKPGTDQQEGATAAKGGQAAAPRPLPEEKRLIIVPFEALDGDAEHAVLARGIAEWLADSMALVEEQTNGAVWTLPPGILGIKELETVQREAGLTLITEGELELVEGAYDLRLRVVDARSDETLREGQAKAGVDGACGLLAQSAEEHARLLGLELGPRVAAGISRLIPDTREACDGYLMGLGWSRSGSTDADLQIAIVNLKAASVADPDFAPALTALAEADRQFFGATRDPVWLDRSREAVDRALALDGDAPQAWLELARIERAGGRKEASLEALEQAAERAPHLALPHLELGKALKETGRLKEAETALQRAIRLRPGDGRYHSELGELYWILEERDAAINQFRESVALTPESYLAYSNVCGVYLTVDMREDAREMCEQSLAIQPNYPAYSNLGYLAYSRSNFGEAVEMYERALELGEGDYLTFGNLGLAYHHMDQAARSRDRLERALAMGQAVLEESPSDPSVMVDLAVYNALLGNRERALDLLGRATSLDIEGPLLMALVGEAYEDAGERDRALEWVKKALESGLEPSWIGNSPTLRRVEAFRSLAGEYGTGL